MAECFCGRDYLVITCGVCGGEVATIDGGSLILSPEQVEQIKAKRGTYSAYIVADEDAADTDPGIGIDYEYGYRDALNFVLSIIDAGPSAGSEGSEK